MSPEEWLANLEAQHPEPDDFAQALAAHSSEIPSYAFAFGVAQSVISDLLRRYRAKGEEKK